MVDSARALGSFQATREALRLRLSGAVEVLWGRYGGPTDDQAEEFLARAVPLVRAGQATTVQTTDAYLALYLTTTPVGLTLDDHVGAAVRNGTEPREVYHRSVVTLRGGLSRRLAYADANRAAVARLTATVETDLQLAHRSASQAVFRQRGISYYRRVTTARSCGLCGSLTSKRYRADRLLPVHGRCDCTVAPLAGGFDPRSAALFGEEPLDSAVHDHGELGPVLAQAGHHFTGPGDF